MYSVESILTEKIYKRANKEAIEFVVQDIMKPFSFDKKVDYIIHGASITGSKEFV